MSDDFKFQASVKIPHGPDNYRDSMLNVRAQTGEEFAQAVNYIAEHAADLATALQTIHASANVSASFAGPGTGNVQQPAPQAPPPQQGWSQQGSQQAAPQQAGPGKMCAHGPMTYREGNGQRGPWKGYFCPTPKGTPNQCKPEFIRD